MNARIIEAPRKVSSLKKSVKIIWGQSLNQCLHRRPMVPDSVGCLFWFKENRSVTLAGIGKAFLQVGLKK